MKKFIVGLLLSSVLAFSAATPIIVVKPGTGTGTGVTDGDKGDVVVSGSGAVWSVTNSSFATNALEATHSTNADFATEASHATNADLATSATYAGLATNATYAATATNLVAGATGADLTLSGVLTANGSGITNLNGLVNVEDFGANGHDAGNDYLAFQAALNVSTNGVFVPAGTYYLSNTLVFPGYYSYLKGAGRGKTLLIGNGAGRDMIHIGISNVCRGGIIEGMYLYGAGTRNGIVIGGATNYYPAEVAIQDCIVSYCTNAAIKVNSALGTKITDCRLSYSGYGMYLETNSGAAQSTTLFVNRTYMDYNTNANLYGIISYGFSYRDCIFEASPGPGAWLVNTNTSQANLYQTLFDHCWFEGNNRTNESTAFTNKAQLVLEGNTTQPFWGCTIRDCSFSTPGLPDKHIYFGAGNFKLDNTTLGAPVTNTLAALDSAYVNIMASGPTVDHFTDSGAGTVSPDVLWGTALGVNPNIFWTATGATNTSGKGTSPKAQTLWVNGGDGTLVPAQSTKGSTTGSSPTTTFNADVVVTDDITANGDAFVGNDLTVTNNLDVGGTLTVDEVDTDTLVITNSLTVSNMNVGTMVVTNAISGGSLSTTTNVTTAAVTGTNSGTFGTLLSVTNAAPTWGVEAITQSGGTNYTLPFAGTASYPNTYLAYTMTGNVCFAFTTNRAAGRCRSVILYGNGKNGRLDFNSDNHLVGTLANGIVVTNTYILSFFTGGTSETNVFVSGQYAE